MNSKEKNSLNISYKISNLFIRFFRQHSLEVNILIKIINRINKEQQVTETLLFLNSAKLNPATS